MIPEISQEQIEEYKQTIRSFTLSPCFCFLRNLYLSKQHSKMERLIILSQQEDLTKINILGGEMKGFKEGFELMENITKEVTNG